MKRQATTLHRWLLLIATAAIAFTHAEGSAYAALCGETNDTPSTAELAGIANRNRVYSGDQAIELANCNGKVVASAASYATFWRSEVMCLDDWNEGWGWSNTNGGTCDDTTAFGTFIKTVWLMEHAHPSHPLINQQNFDPQNQWTTGDENWLLNGGNYLRDKIDWGWRHFTPVNGGAAIAKTWPGLEMQLFATQWFLHAAVLRASTLIHEARHHDVGTVHCDNGSAEVAECWPGTCPTTANCDPNFAYQGSYWFQLSWLESFHRFASDQTTTLAMRMMARDGANILAATRFQNAGGYFLEDMRSHTRYRSSYAAAQFTQTVDIALPDNSDNARLYQDRCGNSPNNFTGAFNIYFDAWGVGNMTLTSNEYGRRDVLRYVFDNTNSPGVSRGLLHMFSEATPNIRQPVGIACNSGGAPFQALSIIGGGSVGWPARWLTNNTTGLWTVTNRANPIRTVNWGSEMMAVFALHEPVPAVPGNSGKQPYQFVMNNGNWRGGSAWHASALMHPAYVIHDLAAGGPMFTPLPVSWGRGRVDLIGFFEDHRLRRRYCDNCDDDLDPYDFLPVGDWQDMGSHQAFWGYDAVSWGPDRLDVFADSFTGAVHHMAFYKFSGFNGEIPWTSLGNDGGFLVNPVAVTTASGDVDVFAIEWYSQTIRRKHFRSGLGWGPVCQTCQWENLGSPVSGDLNIDSLAVVTSGGGNIDIYVEPKVQASPKLLHRLRKPAQAPQGVCFAGDDCEANFGGWTSLNIGS